MRLGSTPRRPWHRGGGDTWEGPRRQQKSSGRMQEEEQEGSRQLGCPEEHSATAQIRPAGASTHVACSGHCRCWCRSPARLASGQGICTSFSLSHSGGFAWESCCRLWSLWGCGRGELDPRTPAAPGSHRGEGRGSPASPCLRLTATPELAESSLKTKVVFFLFLILLSIIFF